MTTGTTGTAASALPAAGGTSSAGLADWAAPYITDYLGKAQALGGMEYQPYQGPLTAGPSSLQTKAFEGIGGLTVPSQFGFASDLAAQAGMNAMGMGYTPGQFSTGTFGAEQAKQYMSPYLEQALTPQMQALQRQADIQRNMLGATAAKSGALGGSRSGLMDSQLNAELMRQQQQTTGQAYQNAYQQAMAQFNADQARQLETQKLAEQSQQFGAGFGLDALRQQLGAAQVLGGLGQQQQQSTLQNLDQLLKAGAIERDITGEGVKADYDEFLRQREFPYKQVQYMRDMISGLPISSVTNTPAQLSGVAQLAASVGGMDKLLKDTGFGDLKTLLKELFGFNLGGGEAAS